MENKTLLEIATAWPFPVLQYTVNTSYIEVRKASGIAYILLQLISNSENNTEKLVVTLKNLGVPGDIHYIFAGEIANMMSYGIIENRSESSFSSSTLDKYLISDFSITDLGKKLFAEGTIPTGNTGMKKLQVYYDVAQKDTLMKIEWRLFPLEESSLDEKCIGDRVLDEADVELFINQNMSRFSFKKGERISEFEHEQPVRLNYKMDDAVTLRITPEKLYIQAGDKQRDEHIHKFYTVDHISQIMRAKKKYHFPDVIDKSLEDYDYADFKNIVKISLPYQLASVTAVKSQLSLARHCKMTGSECAVSKEEALEVMQKCNIQGDACYFESGQLFTIVPGKFLINVDGYTDKCTLNLVVVQQLEEEIKLQVLNEVFAKCIEASEPFKRCSIIKKLTQISKSGEYLEKFADTQLLNVAAYKEKIDIFLKLNAEFLGVSEWKTYAKLTAGYLLEELCRDISIENFAAQNILGDKLNKILGLHDMDYLSKIVQNLMEEEGVVIAYEALEGIGYSTDVVLSVANVFELYCKQMLEGVHISGNSKMSGQCTLLGQTFSELKELTGIGNPHEDSAELDFDQDRFIQVMATFTDAIKNLERYKAYAMEQYKMLMAFKDRFTEVKEVVTIEKEAQKNPKNINSSYIQQRLKKSRYKDAICDLHVRLQYELNRLFATDNMHTYDLLSEAGISAYLSKEEVSSMHELRKCRNGFQHPKEIRDVEYSEKIIREWCAIVEKLGGMDNEPCNED